MEDAIDGREAWVSMRSRSRWLKRLATGIFATLVFAVVIEAAMASRAGHLDVALRTLLPYRLSIVFYVSAIWTMRRAFGRLADGEMFDRVLPSLLTRVGVALAGGAVVGVLVSPLLQRALDGSHRGSFAVFDPAAITIGMVGLLLVVLSGLFNRAAAIERELDEFL